MTLAAAICSLYPETMGQGWTIEEDDYTKLVWPASIATAKPTLATLETERGRLIAENDDNEYQRKRALEYPARSDLIVALWEQVIEGRTASADALEVLRQATKTNNPKPQ